MFHKSISGDFETLQGYFLISDKFSTNNQIFDKIPENDAEIGYRANFSIILRNFI